MIRAKARQRNSGARLLPGVCPDEPPSSWAGPPACDCLTSEEHLSKCAGWVAGAETATDSPADRDAPLARKRTCRGTSGATLVIVMSIPGLDRRSLAPNGPAHVRTLNRAREPHARLHFSDS